MLENDNESIDQIIKETTNLMSETAKKVSKQKTYGKNKLKLNIWNKEIADALKANKQAYKIWKDNGRPMNIDHPLIIEKKLTRKTFRTEIRNEELRRKHNERNILIHSNSGDKNLFYKLIRKQRQNGNTFINDLNVDGETFERDDILSGWHTHFSKLAIPTEHPSFNYQHLQLCEMDYDTILEISRQFTSKEGCTIGETSVNAIACADDVALMSENPAELQLLINIAAEYSQNHHYLLQPQKSVVLQIEPSNRKKQSKSVNLTLNESPMPVVDKSPHLGILRSTSSKNSQNETTEQNITKSRRAAYSLMSAGLHGENGLDPITSLHLIKTFIQPILTYGLEVILPTSSNLLKLEKFQKQLLKRIMSLPICTPDV
ncbi:unnamed protein product [Mytilus edulis]|uniref:Reverse transcriptase domain-containing protein n=1 Tax=Mytilus edulis TaxID=6550 RepID=A0A8S3US45_MYTED|nr:unnamed protein product [Mytilus edulis]